MWQLYRLVLLAGIANAIQAGRNGAPFKGLDEFLGAGLVSAGRRRLHAGAVDLIAGRLAQMR